MLVLQLGHKTNEPNVWVTRHYLRGLEKTIRDGMIPHLREEDTLDDLIKQAANIARNVEFRKSLDQGFRSSTPRSYGTPPSRSSAPSSTSTKSTSGKPRTKITDAERKYLDDNHGCYWCRKINAGHFSRDCPDRIEAEKMKEVKKETVNALEAVVESDSDSEYPRSSVPTIKLATTIQNVELPSSLADCGATINVISSDKVEKHAIPTCPIPPIRIREPMNHQGVLVNKKVVSKVNIPAEKWESCKPAEFVVAPLQEHDAILGMPFLASEKILIDPAHGKLILPSKEKDVEEFEVDDDDDFNHDYYANTMPSFCPKVTGLKEIIPPEPGWIAALKDFDITNAASESTSTTISLTEATKLNEKYVFEYDDVFTDKLPNELHNPDAPRHRIILEDEK